MEPTPHDLRLENTYSTTESLELRIHNESGETVVHRNFTLQPDSAILVETLNYSGPRGAEYAITVVHNEDTETIQATEPWTKLIDVELAAEGISITMVAV